MKIKGIKRGKFIELSEEISLEDGTAIAVEISESPSHTKKHSASKLKFILDQDNNLTNLWNTDRQQATIDLIKSWEKGDSQEQQETLSALKNLDNDRTRKLFTETDYSA